MEQRREVPQNTGERWQARFFTIWTGQQLSLIGSMLAGFALVWWLTAKTGSATVLTTASLVQILPGVLLGPLVGPLIDRWNRRRVMLVADTVVALFSAWLAYLFWVDALQLWQVYVIMAVRAIGGTFHWPAMSASTSLLVPEKHLARVAGINQTMQGILSIVSPPLGALLVSVLPLHGVMAIDVGTAACAILPLLFVHIPQPKRRDEGQSGGLVPTFWSDLREGFSFIWNWSGLRSLLIMATIINFVFNPAGSLIPLAVTEHFHGGASELGWTESCWGIGIVLGGLLLGVWGGFKRRIVTSMVGLVGMGIGCLLFGVAPANAFWLALGGMALAGFMSPLANGPISAIFQSVIPPEMQGRAFTLIGSACSAMSPLGMLIAGPVADTLGVQSWFIICAVTCAALGVYGFTNPVVMEIENNHRQPETDLQGVPASAPVGPSAD